MKNPPASYCAYARSLPEGNPHRIHHDTLHGFPAGSDEELFERLVLEINQAGLSWATILKKLDHFRRAFEGFSIQKVAAYGEADRRRLLADPGIIRNRLKVEAAIHNAEVILRLQQQHGSFRNWLDRHHPAGRADWVRLFRNTFRFTGGEIVNEFLMSTGYLPGAHQPDCPLYDRVLAGRPRWYDPAPALREDAPDTFAERVIDFNRSLRLDMELPPGVRAMNPFEENALAMEASSAFYRRFYSDNRPRFLILGINPGRHGAGVTGIPFTDTKRLREECGLTLGPLHTHEPSSVFVYEVIAAYGGAEVFYSDFYINSPSPLGFLTTNEKGREVNFNYYDSRALQERLRPFMAESVRRHISMGVRTDVAFCLGTGKNHQFLDRLNQEHGFFGRLVPLDHPRFVMQYRSRDKEAYIAKYLHAFREVTGR